MGAPRIAVHSAFFLFIRGKGGSRKGVLSGGLRVQTPLTLPHLNQRANLGLMIGDALFSRDVAQRARKGLECKGRSAELAFLKAVEALIKRIVQTSLNGLSGAASADFDGALVVGADLLFDFPFDCIADARARHPLVFIIKGVNPKDRRRRREAIPWGRLVRLAGVRRR